MTSDQLNELALLLDKAMLKHKPKYDWLWKAVLIVMLPFVITGSIWIVSTISKMEINNTSSKETVNYNFKVLSDKHADVYLMEVK